MKIKIASCPTPPYCSRKVNSCWAGDTGFMSRKPPKLSRLSLCQVAGEVLFANNSNLPANDALLEEFVRLHYSVLDCPSCVHMHCGVLCWLRCNQVVYGNRAVVDVRRCRLHDHKNRLSSIIWTKDFPGHNLRFGSRESDPRGCDAREFGNL